MFTKSSAEGLWFVKGWKWFARVIPEPGAGSVATLIFHLFYQLFTIDNLLTAQFILTLFPYTTNQQQTTWTLFHHIDAFWRFCSRRLFENMATKEEISQNEQFLHLSPCFQLYEIIVLSFKGSFKTIQSGMFFQVVSCRYVVYGWTQKGKRGEHPINWKMNIE